MSAKSLGAHALFLVVALVFAWVQAHGVEEKKGGPTSTTLLDAKKGEVKKLDYQWPKGTSSVEPKGKDEARTAVMTLSREIDAPKAKDAGPDAGPANTTPATTHEDAKFPAGKSVMTSVEAFEPLKTRRTLGDVDAERLKAMGLDKPERSLTVTTTSGQTVALEIGEASYGGQGRYARVKGQSAVHLLDSAVVTGLEGGADTLMEKRIITANLEEIVGYAARFGDKTGEYVQRDREQSAKRKFVAKGSQGGDGDVEGEAPGKLMTTLRNLRAVKVADPKLAASAVATLSVDVVGRDKQKIEVLERTDGAGHLVSTGGWLFELSETQSKELLEDLGALFE